MKKVLSLVLVVVMVFGMSSSAFAMLKKGTTEYGLTANSKTSWAVGTIEVTDAGTVTSPDPAEVSITLTNSHIKETGITFDDGWNSIVVGIPSGLDGIFSSGSAVSSSNGTLAITLYILDGAAVGAFDDYITLVDTNPATPSQKNTFKLRVSGVVKTPGGGTSTGAIPSNVKIDGIADGYVFPSFDYSDMKADKDYDIHLIPDDFKWVYTAGTQVGQTVSTAIVSSWGDSLKAAHLTNVGIRKTSPVNNSGTIKEITINKTNVRITTVKYFTKCGNTDGSFDLQLAFKNQTGGDKGTITFNISNTKVEVDDDDEEIYSDDNVYVQATTSVRGIVMEASDHLFITKNFGKDQKAYCRASLELSAGDEKLFQEYPELDSVYTMITTGVASAGVTAEFRDLGDTYFVYDANFKLLGTTAESKLPWSTKYYLTTKKVDLAGTPAVDEEPASEPTPPVDTDNQGLGGDGANAAAASTNYNPNTGL